MRRSKTNSTTFWICWTGNSARSAFLQFFRRSAYFSLLYKSRTHRHAETSLRRTAAGSFSVSKKSDHDRYRSASYGWTTLSARQSAADFAKSCGTYACTARFGVGVDAYIDPADCTVFTVICGEFATSRRADVGIGPYRVLREFTAAHRADRGVRPYASLGNPTQNRKTIVF